VLYSFTPLEHNLVSLHFLEVGCWGQPILNFGHPMTTTYKNKNRFKLNDFRNIMPYQLATVWGQQAPPKRGNWLLRIISQNTFIFINNTAKTQNHAIVGCLVNSKTPVILVWQIRTHYKNLWEVIMFSVKNPNSNTLLY